MCVVCFVCMCVCAHVCPCVPLCVQDYITIEFDTKDEMKGCIDALRHNMALAKKHTPMVRRPCTAPDHTATGSCTGSLILLVNFQLLGRVRGGAACGLVGGKAMPFAVAQLDRLRQHTHCVRVLIRLFLSARPPAFFLGVDFAPFPLRCLLVPGALAAGQVMVGNIKKAPMSIGAGATVLTKGAYKVRGHSN